MLVKGNISERQTEEKAMKGIREEEKVQKTPCTGLWGIFSSLFLKLFYFVLVVQCKHSKCQKLKTKPGPWHRGQFFPHPTRGGEWQTLPSAPAHTWNHPQDLAWWLCCWTTGGWEELGWGWGCLFLWKGLRRGFAVCYVLHGGNGSQSCPLGKWL